MVTVRQVTVGILGAVIVTALLGSFAGVAVDLNAHTEEPSLIINGGGASLSLGFGEVVREHKSTRASLGTAVELDGTNDSEVTVDGTIALDDDTDTWSVCTWARPTSAANNTTATLIKYQDAAIVYNGTSDDYRGYYYETANRSAVDVTLPDNGTATLKLLCLQRDGGTVTLSRNDSASASVALGSESGVSPPPSTHFAGVIEETRLFNRSLSASERAEWVNEPSLAIGGAAPDLRVMYDARSGTTFRAFFTGGTATASSAQLVDGADAPTLVEGDDYRWTGTLNATLVIPSGSVLEQDNAVVYAQYVAATGGFAARVFSAATSALGLLIIGLASLGLWSFIDDF